LQAPRKAANLTDVMQTLPGRFTGGSQRREFL
jgi:hypothetical protein